MIVHRTYIQTTAPRYTHGHIIRGSDETPVLWRSTWSHQLLPGPGPSCRSARSAGHHHHQMMCPVLSHLDAERAEDAEDEQSRAAGRSWRTTEDVRNGRGPCPQYRYGLSPDGLRPRCGSYQSCKLFSPQIIPASRSRLFLEKEPEDLIAHVWGRGIAQASAFSSGDRHSTNPLQTIRSLMAPARLPASKELEKPQTREGEFVGRAFAIGGSGSTGRTRPVCASAARLWEPGVHTHREDELVHQIRTHGGWSTGGRRT
ncbi:hypothetical protein C8Q76DRAFT_392890 [Earliella scabrosa]|nr:hypothetical protein C8Q76DRAFT_392890 [Earliella scabrosa]